MIYRLVSVIPVLIGISIMVFFMVRLVPGDPIDIMYANRAKPTGEQRKAIEHQMGLDLPIYKQYGKYMQGILLHGDLGTSFRTKQPVTRQIKTRLPNTIKLTIGSLIIALVIGITAGVLAATFRNTWIDRVCMLIAVGGVSIPAFWLGLMLILLFSVHLGWLPVAGARSWKYFVLPSFTLGLVVSAVLARITRASMLEALNQDYVRTARAKGLREIVVVYRHALRNALIPVVTSWDSSSATSRPARSSSRPSSAFPVVGLLAVNALLTRDFPLIQGIVLLVAVIYVVVNVLVDILYGLIDPRIKFG